MPDSVIVHMKDISISFSGNLILNKVNFSLRQGEIHSLMGANGAGKSTLIKILNGIYHQDAGNIILFGKTVKIKDPKDSERYGLAFVHQELNMCPDMTVAENMFIGNWAKTPYGLYDQKQTSKNATDLLNKMGIDLNPDTPVRKLRTAEKQIIEILKTLTRNAKIVVLDEPTSSLTENEKQKFFEIICRLKNKNVSIIFISHFLEDVMHLSDRVTVLKDGTVNGEFTRGEYSKEDLVQAMMGVKVMQSTFKPFEKTFHGEPILKVENLNSKGKFSNISFSINKGDIVGVCGLLGAGKTEIARAIFGLDSFTSGNIYIDGKLIKTPTPNIMLKNKVALLTEERKNEGFIPLLSVRENITLSIIKKLKKGIKINLTKQKKFAQDIAETMLIKMSGIEQPVFALSGGNQQKVVLAKCLASKPRLFLLDEPTRGVDVLAKSEIYKILRKYAKEGISVLIFSSEIEELLSNCSKILILHKGIIINCVDSLSITKNDLLKMLG
ncbi:sugar ABC transporter ATP-binding protein [Treponema parvum]|uniref:Sugar ABC transporter ATP-binding protein n=1 Tax=Treponema parvum TaxID=138851 RepID=A0A975IDC2_9SPIR|nr:sugar ABC transporter ATP-binding protein [Treponema parvum]QTQ12628.1 sugar ABC transporter ATP-binding protein [Treponema parvum]QTQ15395.1 sugar ABC transporter ATP-binding protein [Treponema parvum]